MPRDPGVRINIVPAQHTLAVIAFAVVAVAWPSYAAAVLVRGGGNAATDCVAVFEAAGANKPPPPKEPKHVDCVDGDVSCDGDGLRNARCVFSLQVCLNSTRVTGCSPQQTDSLAVDHAIDDGDSKFDPDFLAVQDRVNNLGLPDSDADDCATSSSITVLLKPASATVFKKDRKKLSLTAIGSASGAATDKDRMIFTCRPEGDAVYTPTDLYTGTFDRIVQQIFVPGCAISACHDSESAAGAMILLPGAAYSQIHGVVPSNPVAAAAGLLRVDPAGDPALSYLYRKLVPDLLPGWGSPMPLSGSDVPPELLEIVRLWIIGDVPLGPAPETGWVEGTDQ